MLRVAEKLLRVQEKPAPTAPGIACRSLDRGLQFYRTFVTLHPDRRLLRPSAGRDRLRRDRGFRHSPGEDYGVCAERRACRGRGRSGGCLRRENSTLWSILLWSVLLNREPLHPPGHLKNGKKRYSWARYIVFTSDATCRPTSLVFFAPPISLVTNPSRMLFSIAPRTAFAASCSPM